MSHPATMADVPSLAAALDDARFEVLPLHGIADRVLEHLPPGRKVTVTSSPSRGLEPTLELVERLAPHGYDVVPHLAARLFADHAELAEVVARLRAAGVRDAFVIAGDAKEPAGAFEGAADLLAALRELPAGFDRRGIAGYPESHHLISDEATIESMFAKEPMATYIVSQICFDADTIAGWIRAVRARGTALPIWVGVPGAVDSRRLLRTSVRIGLGDSIRFLRTQHGLLRRFLRPRTFTPTDLLTELAPVFADPAARVGGIHLYTFNEIETTETWRRQLVDRLTSQEEDPWHR